MKLIDDVDINKLIAKEIEITEWLGDNVFHKDFIKKADELAALRVRIYNYYHNNIK